ncbi:MAG: autotransporter-associated beta strand repeat-containing protein, partial [Verrucomicrobiota bacterium]
MRKQTKLTTLCITAALAALALATAPMAQAATTYTFTGTSGTINWSSGTSWSAIPVSGSDNTLTFGNGTSLAASAAVVANNDIASPPFKHNALNLTYAGPASGTAPTVTIQGNQLEFDTSSGSVAPTMNFTTTGTVKPTVTISAPILFANTAAIATTTDAILSGTLSGAGGFTKSGGGTLRITQNSASWTGSVGLSAGILQIGNNGGFGSLGSGTITLSGSGSFNVARAANSFNLDNTITGSTSGSVNFYLNNSATPTAFAVTLTKANNYTAATTLQPFANSSVGTPTLKNGIDNALSTTTAFTINTVSGATAVMTYDLAGFDQTIASLTSGSGVTTANGIVTDSGAAKTLTISSSSGSTTYAGLISGAIALKKEGASTQTLSGVNTFNGNTTINAGTLALGASASINNTPQISIAAGATFDVSAITTFNLSSSTSLSASGAASAATIKGNASANSVNLGSRPITLNYDGSNPALTISQGSLVLAGNAFTVNGTALAAGSYTIIQQTSGTITTNNPNFTVTGTALGSGTGTLDFSTAGQVKLQVAITPVAGSVSATNSTVTASPASLPADNSTTSTVTVTLKDTNNVAIGAGTNVAWTVSGADNTVTPASSGSTSSGGVVTFTVKSLKAETKTVTVSVGAILITNSLAINFTNPAVGNVIKWDPSLTGTGSDGGGVWDSNTVAWANAGTDFVWPNNGNDNVVIGSGTGAAGTITNGIAVSVGNITFNAPSSGSYVLGTNP